MGIDVKWEGQLVGTIEDDRLTVGTELFQEMWGRFRRNGVPRLAPPDPVPLDDHLMEDSLEIVHETSAFLIELEELGYTIEG